MIGITTYPRATSSSLYNFLQHFYEEPDGLARNLMAAGEEVKKSIKILPLTAD